MLKRVVFSILRSIFSIPTVKIAFPAALGIFFPNERLIRSRSVSWVEATLRYLTDEGGQGDATGSRIILSVKAMLGESSIDRITHISLGINCFRITGFIFVNCPYFIFTKQHSGGVLSYEKFQIKGTLRKAETPQV